MGGCCCCASRSTEPHRSPPFFHYPISEEHEPLSGHHARVSALSTGFLVDTNLDMSVPDTYCSPPAPIPYERYVGRPSTPSGNRGNNTDSGATVEVVTVKQIEPDEKTKSNTELETSEVAELEKSGELKKSAEQPVVLQEEEDTCPTCFEEYDDENPKMVTKCDHHFHLACILEWMERSDTCPVCDQEMVFSPVAGG